MNREEKQPVVLVLMGPTAVGKTALALFLARLLHTEIVNADAIQVYKGMDIGTAKPTPAQRRLVPHHMIDLRTPDQPYSAAEYANEAECVVQRLWRAGKLPLVVGGSGLYIRALIQGVFAGPGANWEIRKGLYRQAKQEGREAVHALLQACDPEAAARIHPHDLHRTVRALEVYYQQGIPISTLQRQHAATPPRYRAILIGLTRERSELYHRINERTHRMMEKGLVAETARLLQQGYSSQLSPLQSLGYKQVIQFLQGKCSLPEAIRWIQRDTRHYARRQLTWMRKMPDLHWINLSSTASQAVVEQIMNLLRQQGLY